MPNMLIPSRSHERAVRRGRMSTSDPEDCPLTQSAGLIELSSRTQVELSGSDCATFLHNLCTNEIAGLAAGQGCEAMLTNVQGKVLAHIFVFRDEDSLILETVPDQSEAILQHLDRYLIREDVALRDLTGEWSESLLSGPSSEDLLSSLFCPRID